MTVELKWVPSMEWSDHKKAGWKDVLIEHGAFASPGYALMASPVVEEPAKVECPNCLQPVGPGWDHEAQEQMFTCNPADEWSEVEPALVGFNKPEPAAPEMQSGTFNYTAAQIREWIRAGGYLTVDQHNRFGGKLPTSNMGRCMEALADALDEIEACRDHSRTVGAKRDLPKVREFIDRHEVYICTEKGEALRDAALAELDAEGRK